MTCGESLCVCMYVCVYAVCTYLDEAERGRGRERKSTPPRLASFCARALLLPFFSFPHLSTDKRPVCRNSYTRVYAYKERADSNVRPLHLEEKSADHEPDFGMLIFLHLIDCRAPLPDRPKDLCGAAIRPRQRRCSDCHWLAAWRNSARLAELPVGCGPPSASLNTQPLGCYLSLTSIASPPPRRPASLSRLPVAHLCADAGSIFSSSMAAARGLLDKVLTRSRAQAGLYTVANGRRGKGAGLHCHSGCCPVRRRERRTAGRT